MDIIQTETRRQAALLLLSPTFNSTALTPKMATRRYARTIPKTTSLSHPSSLQNVALATGNVRSSSTKANGTSAATASKDEKDSLSWSDYLTIRGKKRKWEMATTIPITSFAAFSSISYFGQHTPQFEGWDPLLLSIIGTASVTGLGYLIGPVVGSQMWRLTHRKTLSLIEDKEKLFHQHIKRNRVDPSTQSTTNPVPDFYGEKIGSMKEYRQWLRDQARYRRKASWGDTKTTT